MKNWKLHAKGGQINLIDVNRQIQLPLCSINPFSGNFCFADSNDQVTCKRCLKVLEYTSTINPGD